MMEVEEALRGVDGEMLRRALSIGGCQLMTTVNALDWQPVTAYCATGSRAHPYELLLLERLL